MSTKIFCALTLVVTASFVNFACQKETADIDNPQAEMQSAALLAKNLPAPDYSLNVNLKGWENYQGHLKFRQDTDPAKIIELQIKVHNLLPNHEYLLQRAVDPINVVDGDCTSTSWLTLGEGLSPRSIVTNDQGKGEADLWRDVSAIPSEAAFDIHFQVVDAVSLAVVLSSDCYQYKVR